MDPRFFRRYLDIMNERVVVGPDGKPQPRTISSEPVEPRSPEEDAVHKQAQQDIADTLKARDARIDAENQALRQQGQTRSFRPPK
jgi:hypothetical protein